MSMPWVKHNSFYSNEQIAVRIIYKKYWLFGRVVYIDQWHTKDGYYFDPLKFNLVESKKTLKYNFWRTRITCIFKPFDD